MNKPMTKDEFTRKLMGQQQTRKNNYLKSLTTNTDADAVTFGNTAKIKKQKHIKW